MITLRLGSRTIRGDQERSNQKTGISTTKTISTRGRLGHVPRDGYDTGPGNSNGEVEARKSGG